MTSPQRLNTNSSFNRKSRSRSRSPNPVGKTDISIRIDPATPATPASREGSPLNPVVPFRDQTRFVIRSYEYDRELIRRQLAMIAVQPMSTSEEIEEKRRMLQIKADARRQADAAVRASHNLGVVRNQGERGRSMSRTRSISKSAEDLSTIIHGPRSPSPYKSNPLGSIGARPVLANNKVNKK